MNSALSGSNLVGAWTFWSVVVNFQVTGSLYSEAITSSLVLLVVNVHQLEPARHKMLLMCTGVALSCMNVMRFSHVFSIFSLRTLLGDESAEQMLTLNLLTLLSYIFYCYGLWLKEAQYVGFSWYLLVFMSHVVGFSLTKTGTLRRSN